jgi:hypothetical protein
MTMEGGRTPVRLPKGVVDRIGPDAKEERGNTRAKSYVPYTILPEAGNYSGLGVICHQQSRRSLVTAYGMMERSSTIYQTIGQEITIKVSAGFPRV